MQSAFELEHFIYATSCAMAPETVIFDAILTRRHTTYRGQARVVTAAKQLTVVGEATSPGLTSTMLMSGDEITFITF